MDKKEKELLSNVASDLLTGNHLLGRKRSEEHMAMMAEFCKACLKLESDATLSDRDKELFLEMSDIFYGGMEDMCGQLEIAYSKLQKILK